MWANFHTLSLHGSFSGASPHWAIQAIHVSKQAINQSVMHAHLVWKGKGVTVSVPPRPDLRVQLQSSAGW